MHTVVEFQPGQLTHERETEPSRPRGAAAWLAGLLTRHYLPWTERYLRWLRQPLALLILADAGCALCGAVLHPNCFLLFAAVTSMIVLGVVWPWLSLVGVAGEVAFAARRGREQHACDVVLRLSNRCPWPAWGLTLEAVLDQGIAAAVDCVPGWRCSEYVWPLTPTRRGVYPRGTPVLTTSFPFGLWQAQRPLRRANRIVVWPTPLGPGALGRAHGEERFDGEASLSRPGLGGDLLGVRPYQRGDSLRRIHWGKSAQLDRLMTCERQCLVRLQAQVVVDTHSGSRGERNDTQEWVIRVAAGVGCGLIDQGTEVTMVVGGRLVRLPGSDARRAMLDLLAQLEAGECPALASVLALSPVRRFQGQSQIVVTTTSGYERLPSAARAERRRRYVVLNPSCEKGGGNLLCEAPFGPHRQKFPVASFASAGDDDGCQGSTSGE